MYSKYRSCQYALVRRRRARSGLGDRSEHVGRLGQQSSGLYAHEYARRGYAALAFAPSFAGQSDGEVPDVASPDICTEDFSAAVDFLGLQDIVYRERIGLHAICGLSGMALTAAAADSRIRAVATSSMNDMSRNYHDSYTPSGAKESSATSAGGDEPTPRTAPTRAAPTNCPSTRTASRPRPTGCGPVERARVAARPRPRRRRRGWASLVLGRPQRTGSRIRAVLVPSPPSVAVFDLQPKRSVTQYGS
ncbi:hypothetical protein [Streptomyces sp. SJL17-4]|uniref:alpha/beta hydrolase n=1 Tax=Streptomyces sp. SJL17-4 TaxID=2967224 RepID=UPI0030D51EE1